MFQQSQCQKEIYYSRQIATFGCDTQQKIEQLDCFIYGLKGLGLEIAKNLILMGLKRVMIYDKTIVQISDLGTNFYNKLDQVGQITREKAIIQCLKDLNQNVIVEIYNGNINGDNLRQFSIVILTDIWDQTLIQEINEAVRQQGNGFILAHSSGLFGSVFVDFSDNFIILDDNGEKCKEVLIGDITCDLQGIVYTLDMRHQFSDGDYVTFKEVVGMIEVNDQVFKITVLSPYSFSIGDTTKFSKYQRYGRVIQVKIPQKVQFKSFKNMLCPEINGTQSQNERQSEKSNELQIAYNSILTFMNEYKRIPHQLDNEDAQQIFEIASKKQKEKCQQLDIKLIKNISLYLQTQIIQLTSFWGGIVSLEVIKFTGKYTPIIQWYHQDFYEALPEVEVNRTLKNCQYDNYIAIFGQETVEKLQNQNILMIGVGGLGNEYLKIFSLMGVGSGQKGQLMIVDDDQIELSNLNGQYLFKNDQIGSNKAIIGCSKIQQMNQQVKCKAFTNRISKDNEQIYNQSFWNNIDFVVNAVDNIQARHYIDYQCCYYAKPTFESGVEGIKCHSQVILPFQTETFSESKDQGEIFQLKSVINSFPYLTEHNIQWALNYIQQEFVQISEHLSEYSQRPNTILKQLYNDNKHQLHILQVKLEKMEQYILLAINPNQENLVRFAKSIFQSIFNDQIKHLLDSFPADYIQQNGLLFWTNPKRQPKTIQFDLVDPLHQQFIYCVVNIVLQILGQPTEINSQQIQVILNNIENEQIQSFQKQFPKIENEQNYEHLIIEYIDMLIVKLESLFQDNQINISKFKSFSFQEKNLNYQVLEFITSAANLRSINYNLQNVSRIQVRQQIEQIIPQLITTKSVITGIVGIEILKFIQQKNINIFRNTFINLALPIFVFSQPKPPFQNVDQDFNVILCEQSKAIPNKWTSWNIIKINKKMTIGEMIQYFEHNYNVKISFIGFNNQMIYSKQKKSAQELLQKDCADLYAQVSKSNLNECEINFDVVVDSYININGQEICVDFPPIKYHYQI